MDTTTTTKFVSITVGAIKDRERWSGISPGTDRDFVDNIERHGHATTQTNRDRRPINHYLIGCGVGHDDAEFSEYGRSMAAYYENGEAYGGRWWEDDRDNGTLAYYDPAHPRFQSKTYHHPR